MRVYDDGMKWLALLPELLNRIPVERLLTRPPDNRKRLEELQGILSNSEPKRSGDSEPRAEDAPQRRVRLQPKEGGISTEETVDYQNREIAKLLLRMEGHCTQKFRLFGKICECGAAKHLLDLESLCEETIPMVDNPDTYYRIIDLGRELSPKCTPEAVATLQYDDEFPSYARQYRDMRKQLVGYLDVTEIERPEPGEYFPEGVDASE